VFFFFFSIIFSSLATADLSVYQHEANIIRKKASQKAFVVNVLYKTKELPN